MLFRSAFASHAAWDVTRRRPGVLAHRTRFVEIGPVTALSATAAAALLPFPDLQMGWGLDARWSAIAAERGWPVIRWTTGDDNYRARAVYDKLATRTMWVTYDMATA